MVETPVWRLRLDHPPRPLPPPPPPTARLPQPRDSFRSNTPPPLGRCLSPGPRAAQARTPRDAHRAGTNHFGRGTGETGQTLWKKLHPATMQSKQNTCSPVWAEHLFTCFSLEAPFIPLSQMLVYTLLPFIDTFKKENLAQWTVLFGCIIACPHSTGSVFRYLIPIWPGPPHPCPPAEPAGPATVTLNILTNYSTSV